MKCSVISGEGSKIYNWGNHQSMCLSSLPTQFIQRVRLLLQALAMKSTDKCKFLWFFRQNEVSENWSFENTRDPKFALSEFPYNVSHFHGGPRNRSPWTWYDFSLDVCNLYSIRRSSATCTVLEWFLRWAINGAGGERKLDIDGRNLVLGTFFINRSFFGLLQWINRIPNFII